MKIAFIIDFLSKSHFGREPLGLLYIVSVLKKQGVDVKLQDISEVRSKPSVLKKFEPNLIGYSIKTGYHRKFISLNKQLKKEFKFISLFGGPHATFCPDIIEKEGVDIVCRGEAERAIIRLIDGIERGDYIHTDNCWIKKDGVIHKNSLGSLIDDLDSLPFPDRDVMDVYPLFKNFKMRNFLSGRGCPFACAYCYNYAFSKMYENKGKYFRRRSVQNLVDEIVYEKNKNNLNFVNFEDDIFALDKKWLSNFNQIYSREVSLPFHCHVRADVLDEEMVSLLKDAGCYSVSLGLESGNEFLRDKILQKKISNNLFLKACSLLKSYRINVVLQNMLGIPDTGLNHDLETLDLNIQCGADYSIVSMLTPYPGTLIAQMYPYSNWNKINDYYEGSVYDIDDKNQRENLRRLFSIFLKVSFLRPIVPFLIRLPLGLFYYFLGEIWKYFWGRRKTFPTGFKEIYIFSYIKHFFLKINEK